MSRARHTLGHIIAYHGCDASVGEKALAGLESYDTVFGVFDEGAAAYPGAGFREKTHIQLAVRNTDVIIGYFRVQTIVLGAR